MTAANTPVRHMRTMRAGMAVSWGAPCAKSCKHEHEPFKTMSVALCLILDHPHGSRSFPGRYPEGGHRPVSLSLVRMNCRPDALRKGNRLLSPQFPSRQSRRLVAAAYP